jgi:nicotinamidase-related amidase
MSACNTALLVIDVQESFRHRPYFRDEGLPAFLEKLQALADGAREAGIPVIQILHVEATGDFSIPSGHVMTLEPLMLAPDVIFHKSRHSAFVGTDLAEWLAQSGITRLIVSGIRTEQCCETTARHGSDLGFDVEFVSEATLTFPMHDAAGREWSAAEIRARTELVIADRFARITSVDGALSDARGQLAT